MLSGARDGSAARLACTLSIAIEIPFTHPSRFLRSPPVISLSIDPKISGQGLGAVWVLRRRRGVAWRGAGHLAAHAPPRHAPQQDAYRKLSWRLAGHLAGRGADVLKTVGPKLGFGTRRGNFTSTPYRHRGRRRALDTRPLQRPHCASRVSLIEKYSDSCQFP